MAKITRMGSNAILSNSVEYHNFVFLAGITADDLSQDVSGQTRQILAKIDDLLEANGTDKSRLLNAPGGIADYATPFGPLLGAITAEQAPYDFDVTTVDRVAAERRAALPLSGIEERSAWRDRRLMALLAHRQVQER